MMNERQKDIFVWATIQHGNQMYGDETYDYHLRDVFSVLYLFSIEDEEILTAAICHDILEDTTLTYNDLAKVIGVNAANIVYDVTNELGKNRKERAFKTYPKIAANPKAIVVKIADRIANTIYSKKSDSSMYDKYCREFPDFKSHLYTSASLEAFPVLKEMWFYLENNSK